MAENKAARIVWLAVHLAGLTILVASSVQAQVTQGAMRQIESMQAEKMARSPAQRKMASQLIHGAKMKKKEAVANGVASLRMDLEEDAKGRVKVDIDATVTEALLAEIARVGGEVISSVPAFGAIRAWLPVEQIEPLAARKDVTFIKPAVRSARNVGSVTSEGDATHLAAVARAQFGATGAGVKVGVLSDSLDLLTPSRARGDLGAVTVLPGQAGGGAGEGTAMLEIVHDLAPDAELFFATGVTGSAAFAQNILSLAQAGCDIIVDDIIYFDESPFQDDLIARAVNEVTSQGVLFFSSAGNSGNKNDNQSGTWEGDYRDSGVVFTVNGQPQGRIHDFGGQVLTNRATAEGLASLLFWSDPLGGSSNDYDLYILDAAGTTVVSASTTLQDGTQDPYEQASGARAGEQVVIVLFSGSPRFLHFEELRGRLTVSTEGNIRGHNSATGAFAVAATPAPNPPGPFPNPFNPSNQVETFSSDGPRRIFFEPDGTPVTPGNFLSTGGVVRPKPDLTAADGVKTTLPPSTGLSPFFGTSAAAPHAAAIAALVKSIRFDLTMQQLRSVLTASTIDIEATGFDRDSGSGILMADRALAAVSVSFSVTLSAAPPEGGSVSGAGSFRTGSRVTVTAIPASGFRFVSWTEEGQVVSTDPTYTFVISGDRTLTADFAPAFQGGTYQGLITAAAPSHESSGEIQLVVKSSGVFSASLVFGGWKSSFSGKFDTFGQFSRTITRRSAEPIQIVITLDTISGAVIGFVSGGENLGNVSARRVPFHAKTNPAPQAGKYTVLLVPALPFIGDPDFPQGIGAGTMVVDRAGRVRIVATLGDGTKVTDASTLSLQETCPFFVIIYKGRGSVGGFIQFEDQPASDAEGMVNWFKPPVPKDRFYPAGFSMQSAFLASRYRAPARGERILPFPDIPNNAVFATNGGNLNPEPEPKQITVTRNNRVISPPGDRLKLTFTTKTGLFGGSFIAPGSGRKILFTGAVFQKEGIGAGWFRGNGQVGGVLMEPTTTSATPLRLPDAAAAIGERTTALSRQWRWRNLTYGLPGDSRESGKNKPHRSHESSEEEKAVDNSRHQRSADLL